MDPAMPALVPGRRQFDEVMLVIDPTFRRKTQSKTLDYKPGAWDAIKLGHASGVENRVPNKFGLTELPRWPKDQSKRSPKGQYRARRRNVRRCGVRLGESS